MPESEIRVFPEGRHARHVLVVEGQDVSGLSVVDLQMRVGGAVVHMGGIAGVWTDHRHRYKGYSRRVLENSNQWMTEQGYDCAMLFGIPNFYPKFGYAACLPECEVRVRTRDGERAEAALVARPLADDDLPAVRELYAADNARLTGSIVRSEGEKWFRKGSGWEVAADAVVFTDETGTVVAYAAADRDEERAIITEVCAATPTAYASIVRWAADRAVAARNSEVTFLLPAAHPFAGYLALYGAQLHVRFARAAEAMGRLLNLETFFAKTRYEWTNRAAAAATITPGASVRLETDMGNLTLHWDGSAISYAAAGEPAGIVRLPQSVLMQLVMGYYGADLLPALPGASCDGELSLLRALFPRRLGYMWQADHF